MKNDFQPDYTNLLKVLYNQRPDYLPLYEHNIDEPFIAKMLGREVDSTGKSGADLEEHYRVVTEFWRANTYDALSYEAKICEIYPDHGAILGGRLGQGADLQRVAVHAAPNRLPPSAGGGQPQRNLSVRTGLDVGENLPST